MQYMNYRYNYIDRYNMVLHRGSHDHGKGDAIGRTFFAYKACGHPMFSHAIHDLWIIDDKHASAQRHPELNDSISRDHLIYSLLALRDTYTQDAKAIVRNMKWRIPYGPLITPDVKAWMSYYVVGNKLSGFLFYLISVLMGLVNLILYKAGNLIGGFAEEMTPEQWDRAPREERYIQLQPRWKRRVNKIMPPPFAIHVMGWMVYHLPDSVGKRVLQKIYRPMIGQTNYLTQILFGQHPSFSYRPMNGWRWSAILNERNNRFIRTLTGPETGLDIDKDLLIKMSTNE